MKHFVKIGLSSLIALSFAFTAWATEYTQGVVRKIDADAGKVTVAHGELKNLEMPAMTMIFRVADEAMLARLNAGDEIEFIADRRNGKLTIIELK